MNQKNMLKSIFGAVVIVAAVVFPFIQASSVNAQPISLSDPGMGDLQRFEADGYSPIFGQAGVSSDYVGMGDLHVFDAEGLVQISGDLVTANPNVGMGDLQAFESEDIVLPLDQLAS